MKASKNKLFILLICILTFYGCTEVPGFSDNFNQAINRIWIGPNYLQVPLEDWQIHDGRIENIGQRQNMRVNLLTQKLTGKGKLNLSFQTGIPDKSTGVVSGVNIGLHDNTENSIRSLSYYGKGLEIGLTSDKELFVGLDTVLLPDNFIVSDVKFDVYAKSISDTNTFVSLTVTDSIGSVSKLNYNYNKPLNGTICLMAKAGGGSGELMSNHVSCWFDNIQLKGSMLTNEPENAWGPILWSMYTLNRGKLKMSVQMPPLGLDDDKKVTLQIKDGQQWKTISESEIENDACLAVFSSDNWDMANDVAYRLVYHLKNKNGDRIPCYYDGVIRSEPRTGQLTLGGLTCQEWGGYPYTPVVHNLGVTNPDMLFFSGDQIYEQNGGYGIIRDNPEKAILNYLGKWYMFGWAFGDLMRNRPTICIPDDHEMFQGNLWGEGGKKVTVEEWNKEMDCIGGIVQPLKMVNVVMRTNCAHLPSPYDPTPMSNEIPVYYTHLVYGNVSFAIIGDRIFKSGPNHVSWWKGRLDHIKDPSVNPANLENKELQMLGERQEKFLNHWVTDWDGAKMKCVLSQTIFANACTHSGPEKMYLLGDMDSGGWPKSGRDRALNIMRKAFSFHVVGDQHIPSLIHYGIKKQRDAGWVFCTPAISVGYERRFLPDTLGITAKNRPGHNLPNTGEYRDFFGNFMYIYAIGVPKWNTRDENRFNVSNNRTSGFGLVHFDTESRDITCDAIRFLPKADNIENMAHFPGWPHTVNQLDNYGRDAKAWLPEIETDGIENAVIEVLNQKSGELEYCLPIPGKRFSPKVFQPGSYRLKITDSQTGKFVVLDNILSKPSKDDSKIIVNIDRFHK